MHNTATRFGFITRAFHWLTALLILTAIVLGVLAHDAAYDTSQALARKAWLFSFHKTVGITAFFVAIARVAWAISQPRPGLLNADKRMESLLAEVIHWALYASMIVVPLAGWITHAASEGFAPIWWPLGQNLPFIPKSAALSGVAGQIHMAWEKILIASIVLHVIGALKHHFIDKDDTLRRMMFGVSAGQSIAARHSIVPPALATAVFVVVAGVAGTLAQTSTTAAPVDLAAAPSEWTVQDGTLSITVQQFGAGVTGQFDNWTAAISFDPAVTSGEAGRVEVTVDITSLTLGSITDQAMGPGYFDAAQFATAQFTGTLMPTDVAGTYRVPGTLTLKGIEQPLDLTTQIVLEGGNATATGSGTTQRMLYNIGADQTDQGTLGFEVAINFDLTATP